MKLILSLFLIGFLYTGLLSMPIKHHNIKITLDPAKHYLKGNDLIEYPSLLTSADTLYLPSNLQIKTINCKNKKIQYEVTPDSSGYDKIVIHPSKNSPIYSIQYEGTIYFALQGRNLNQGHDFSRGMISDVKGEGIFLPSGSWYPIHDNGELTSFSVTALCPKEFSLITSGKENFKVKKNNNQYLWQTELPTEGLTLCGNKFVVEEREIDGTRIAVYLLQEDAGLMSTYLKAMEDIYKKYVPLLGPYPFSSFSMVENFFASGYGMPNYTLLAKDIVKMPFIVTAPGSLAHEFCHNWWGNSVYVQQGTGNWCEALTTFCANYYWYEIINDTAKQKDYRKTALFEINQLAPEKNYPLADFVYQRNDDDAVIGYQKGSMFFYELYELTGKDVFFKTLRQFAVNFKGKNASWMDFKNTLLSNSTSNSSDIEKVFDQYLNRLDLPKLKLTNVTHNEKQWTIHLEQSAPPFDLQIPFEAKTSGFTNDLKVTMRDLTTSFTFSSPDALIKVDIDPDYQILRSISQDEMPYNMNRVMSGNPLFILPSKGEAQNRLQMLVMMLKQSGYEFTSLPADSVGISDLKNRNIFILGRFEENEIFNMLPQPITNSFTINKSSFEANGKEYKSPTSSMLLSLANPFNKAKLMTIYVWNNDSAVPSFRKMFHYQNQSWQVFDLAVEQNKPVDSGDLYPKSNNELVWEKK